MSSQVEHWPAHEPTQQKLAELWRCRQVAELWSSCKRELSHNARDQVAAGQGHSLRSWIHWLASTPPHASTSLCRMSVRVTTPHGTSPSLHTYTLRQQAQRRWASMRSVHVGSHVG